MTTPQSTHFQSLPMKAGYAAGIMLITSYQLRHRYDTCQPACRHEARNSDRNTMQMPRSIQKTVRSCSSLRSATAV